MTSGLAPAFFAGLAMLTTTGGALGQWVEAPGSGWVNVSIFHHDTRERYDFAGDEEDFFAEGHAIATSLYVTGALGLFKGVDAWLQFPIHRIDFTDAADSRTKVGIGDSRILLRVAPGQYLGWNFPLAIRAGVKLDHGDFPVDAEQIPLGEGQRDWEVMAEVGHSFYPRSAYWMGWLGYRWREESEKLGRDFGNEVFFYSAVGGSASRFSYKFAVEGWFGDTPIIEGFPVVNAKREMLQLFPSIFYGVGPGSVELGGRFPLRGKNLPSGPALVVGYFTNFKLFGAA